MRHRKNTVKLGRNSSHRRCMLANMLKSLVHEGRVVTTEAKAKLLVREADRLVTMAKRGDLHNQRRAKAELMIRYNPLTAKEQRRAREGDKSAYNVDRQVIGKLFGEIGPKFSERQGGYTRIIRTPSFRRGDNSQKCIVEFVE